MDGTFREPLAAAKTAAKMCRKVACILSELNIPYRTIYVDFSKVVRKS